MPTVIAQAVMKIGRNRSACARWSPPPVAGRPMRQWSLMNVTSITEFEIETPSDMIAAPMNDSMFSAMVLVRYRMAAIPAITPGDGDRDQRTAGTTGEVRGQEDEDHDHGHAQSDPQRP